MLFDFQSFLRLDSPQSLGASASGAAFATSTGDIFDVPVTVTITYTDGKTADHVVLATEASSTARLPVTGPIRSVDANQDGGAVAVIERKQ